MPAGGCIRAPSTFSGCAGRRQQTLRGSLPATWVPLAGGWGIQPSEDADGKEDHEDEDVNDAEPADDYGRDRHPPAGLVPRADLGACFIAHDQTGNTADNGDDNGYRQSHDRQSVGSRARRGLAVQAELAWAAAPTRHVRPFWPTCEVSVARWRGRDQGAGLTGRGSAHPTGTELHADPRAGGLGGLRHGVLPGALAAAAHDEQVPMPDLVPDRGAAAA